MRQILLKVLIIFILLSCAKESNKKSSPVSTPIVETHHELYGVWETDCQSATGSDYSYKLVFRFDDELVDFDERYYNNDFCTEPAEESWVSKYNINIDESEKTLDFNTYSVLMAAYTDYMVNEYNSMELCEINDWTIDEYIEVVQSECHDNEETFIDSYVLNDRSLTFVNYHLFIDHTYTKVD